MSIASMNWALRQRLSSAHQQILLYVIADSADPNGVTRHCDPGYLEEHARMTRATMFRRLGELEELGLLQRLKFYSERGAPIYEIRLTLSAFVNIDIKRRSKVEDDADDEHDSGTDTALVPPESQSETLVEETKVSPSASPESQYCDSISPPVSEESPPNPPPGGVLSKAEVKASEGRDALWQRFVAGYPGIAAMDQQAARAELDQLPFEDAEWAVAVLADLRDELKKLKRPAKNAHLWLKKGMFRNFPKPGTTPAPAPDRFAADSPEGRAVQAMNHACGGVALLVIAGQIRYAPGVDPQVMAFAEAPKRPKWRWSEDSEQIGSWRGFAASHAASTNRDIVVTRRVGTQERRGAWLPWPFPPSVNGVIYDWPAEDASGQPVPRNLSDTAAGESGAAKLNCPESGLMTDEDAEVLANEGSGR